MTLKVDEMTEAPVVGRMYLVPCVWWSWANRWMPVVGPVHADPELGVSSQHLHYDLRFIGKKELAGRGRRAPEQYMTLVHMAASDERPTYRIRKCVRTQPEFPAHGSRWQEFEKRWHGTIAKNCKVCPHRGVRLDVCPTDAGGGVVCPGHGLRWNRKTGELMPREVIGV